jgi:hypothetical protein
MALIVKSTTAFSAEQSTATSGVPYVLENVGAIVDELPSTLTQPCLRVKDIHPKYFNRYINWQGIPTLAKTRGGRLWAAWYGGPVHEGHTNRPEDNFVMLYTSDDDGKTWLGPVAIADFSGFYNAQILDPCLWVAPDGSLYFEVTRIIDFTRENRPETNWKFKAEHPEDPLTKWSPAAFNGYGITLNKPTVLSDGSILNPVLEPYKKFPISIYKSTDGGNTFHYFSECDKDSDKRLSDGSSEMMIAERKDKSLLMFVRKPDGIYQSESFDGGKTWSALEPFTTEFSQRARFSLLKLRSGRMLLVANDSSDQRRFKMTAFLSDDDGITFPHTLLLDERETSYPDTFEDEDGYIYVIYDHGRYVPDQKEILFSKVSEQEILNGKLSDDQSFLSRKISSLSDDQQGPIKRGEFYTLLKDYEKTLTILEEQSAKTRATSGL